MERKFKVGDKVEVINEDIFNTNVAPKGAIGTIQNTNYDDYTIQFKGGKQWVRFDTAKKYIKKYKKAPKVIFRDNATILIKDGKKYVARCCDGDTYDREKGLLVCLAKANGITFDDLQEMLKSAEVQDKKQADKVKEVKRAAKVGEYIKIVDEENTKGCYKNGDILKVYKINYEFGGVYCELEKKSRELGLIQDNGNVIIFNSEYVVLENYNPYKITLSEFMGNTNYAIHINSQEQLEKVAKACKRYNRFSFLNDIDYRQDMCISGGKCGDGWDEIEWHKHHNYKIYEFNEVDLNN